MERQTDRQTDRQTETERVKATEVNGWPVSDIAGQIY